VKVKAYQSGDSLARLLIEIFDDSSKHIGHMGARPGGETHFRIIIYSISIFL
jgi:stress-induced morphogen